MAGSEIGVVRAAVPAAVPAEDAQRATPQPAANVSVARQHEIERLLHSGSTRSKKPVLPRLPEPAAAATRAAPAQPAPAPAPAPALALAPAAPVSRGPVPVRTVTTVHVAG